MPNDRLYGCNGSWPQFCRILRRWCQNFASKIGPLLNVKDWDPKSLRDLERIFTPSRYIRGSNNGLGNICNSLYEELFNIRKSARGQCVTLSPNHCVSSDCLCFLLLGFGAATASVGASTCDNERSGAVVVVGLFIEPMLCKSLTSYPGR